MPNTVFSIAKNKEAIVETIKKEVGI